jgi:hypothetical protein
MTTIGKEINQLELAISKALTSHGEKLELQQEQIKCLTQLLNVRPIETLDSHCLSAISRLTDILDRHQQSNQQVYNILTSLKEAKNAQNLTLNHHGEISIYLKLELPELAQRLKIDRATKLSAANSPTAWSKLMDTHPDPEGYLWQFPEFKRGFYNKTHLQVTGIKAIEFAGDSSSQN